MTGVDDMSTQDVFGYFKEYPPAHIEWIDDTSCEYDTRGPDPDAGVLIALMSNGFKSQSFSLIAALLFLHATAMFPR